MMGKENGSPLTRLKQIGFGTNGMLLSILIGLFIVAGFLSSGFLKLENLFNIARIVSLTGIMAVGITYVMLVGEIDLSVGAIMSLSAVMGGRFVHLGIAQRVPVYPCEHLLSQDRVGEHDPGDVAQGSCFGSHKGRACQGRDFV